MTLYIVRHGETFSNRQDIIDGSKGGTLTEIGKKQSELTGKRLAQTHFDKIYVSDLSRARGTAKEIIKYHPNTPVVYDVRLQERSYGIFEGKTKEEYIEYVREFREKNPEVSFFNIQLKHGETLLQAKKRFVACVEDIWQREKGKTVLLVTHGTVERLFIMHIKNIPEDRYFESGLKLGNCGISIVRYDNTKHAEVESINDTEHLQ